MRDETRVEARQNPTDAAMERHIWPDGDWHHETCRCGAPHPCDAGILARSLSTALEQNDFHNDRANAAIARAEAAERERDELAQRLDWRIERSREKNAEIVAFRQAFRDLDDALDAACDGMVEVDLVDTQAYHDMLDARERLRTLARPAPSSDGAPS